MKRSLAVAIGLLIAGCAPKEPPTVYVTMPGPVRAY